MTRILSPILYAVFFLSGAAALLFETLWFRQAGLTFGNSITASSLVLAAFMGGLALGNGLSARLGRRVVRPVRVYALLEIAIALSGVVIVWILPALTAGLSAFLASFLDQPLLLNALRLVLSFVLLIVPTTAMGATLPILVRALRVRDDASISGDAGGFGIALGRLYACNTLGAVVGAVAGEVAIIEWVGVLGTAWVAAVLDLIAAGGALGIARYFSGTCEALSPKSDGFPNFRARCLLGAAFLSGAVLLALEVVWFRFLHLFVPATTLAFAVMLSVVLTGIGVGGGLAARWLRRDARAFRVLPAIALGSGILTVTTYLTFVYVVTPFGTGYIGNISQILTLSVALMFPVSLLSGILFTFTGAALNRHIQPRYSGRWPAHTRQYHRCWSGCAYCGFWAVADFGHGDRNFYSICVLRCCRVSRVRSAPEIPGVLCRLCRVSSHPDPFSLWPNGEYVLHLCRTAFWLSRYMENRRYARRAHGDDYLFGRGLFWRAGCVPDAHGWLFDGVE